MNIFNLSNKLCAELDPVITSITLLDENQITGEMQLSFVLECYDWEQYSFNAYNQGLLEKRFFEITCAHCIESTVTVGGFSDMAITNQHPLLFKYILPHSELYFSSAPENPYEILGLLVEAHKKSYQDWRPLSDCVNEDIIEVLQGGFGLLATGPKFIMDAYRFAISDMLKFNVIESDFSKEYQLLLMSDGYIICRDVCMQELRK